MTQTFVAVKISSRRYRNTLARCRFPFYWLTHMRREYSRARKMQMRESKFLKVLLPIVRRHLGKDWENH